MWGFGFLGLFETPFSGSLESANSKLVSWSDGMSDYKNGCPILEDELLRDDEYVCPRCGKVCESLTEYHKHAKKDHGVE